MTEFTKGYLIGFLVGVVCMIICATTHDYLENAEKKYDSITAHITTQQEAKKLAENFSKQCTELELKLSHFMTDEELSFMNANPKSRLELAEENQQLKKILRDIRNINSHGNMEYFGEAVMEILNNTNKSLWEEK